MAYRTDIEIAVKGARQLKELQDQIKVTGIKISVLNDNLNASGKLLTKSFNSVKTVVAEAAKNFDEAALGTGKAVTAAREYYQASKVLNNALRERAKLLDDIERAERGVILANIRASQAARKASGFGAFSADIDVPTQKAIRRNKEKRERIQAAAETAAQIDKLNTTQEEFITRTNAAAQAAARQTAEFYRQARAAKAVAKINAVAGPAQLLLPAATPGSPAMSGGARRRITGQVERLGGARTEDEAAIALRLAENIKQQVRPLSQVEALYAGIATEAAKLQSIKALPSSQMLNAAARGLQQIKTGQDKYNAELAESQERLEVLNRLEETRARRAKKLRDIATYYETGGISDPISGTGSTGIRVPGSVGNKTPKTGSALGTRAENVLIGGAFPLLFGGGPGAVLGGAAGGLIPGSPMLSVVTSALGAAVDQFAQATAEVGNALRDPIKNFATLADKGLLASKSQEKYIQKLIEAGRITEATAIIQDEIIKKIGVQGVKALQNAGKASDELNKAMSELGLQIQAALSGPLAGFLTWMASVIALGNDVGREAASQSDIFAGLSSADQKELKRQESELLRGATVFNEAAKREEVSQLYRRFAPRATINRPGTTTDPTAAEQAAGRTNELQSQVDLAQKQLTLAGLTLEKDGQAYVLAVQAVAKQEYDNELLRIKNSQIGKAISQKDIELQQAKAKLAYDQQILEINRQVTRDAEARRKAQAGLFDSLSKEYEKGVDLQVKEAGAAGGRLAAIEKTLELFNYVSAQKAYQLDLEFKLATEQARTNGTVVETLQLYKQKFANLEKSRELARQELEGQKQLIQIEKDRALIQARADAARPFKEFRAQIEAQNQATKTYLRLVTEGMIPAEAERLVQFEQIVREQVNAIDEQIRLTEESLKTAEAAVVTAEAYGAATKNIQELKDKLAELKEQRGEITRRAAEGPGDIATKGQQLDEYIAKTQGELNDLEALAVRVADGIGNAIADSMSQGIVGLIEGTKDAQQVFADFLKSVGDILIQEGTRMIAMYIAIGIAKAFAGLGGKGGKETNTQFMERTGNLDLVGDSYKGLQGFATGGFVTGPTRAVVGEGGEPEYVIPQSKMRGAMSRYAAGARGSGVIPQNGDSMAAGGGGGQTFTLETVVINNVEYATVDQVRAMGQQAASQGAQGGFTKSMRTLQNSRSQRSKLGLGR